VGTHAQRSTSTTVGRLARDNKKLLVVIKMKKASRNRKH
jgi:hypothetical protein